MVSKYGAKKLMIIAALFYALFIIAMTTKFLLLIYLASCLLGIAASFLWTGLNSYLVRATNEENRGAGAGFFSTLLSVGSAVGVLVGSFLIAKFSYQLSFLVASLTDH